MVYNGTNVVADEYLVASFPATIDVPAPLIENDGNPSIVITHPGHIWLRWDTNRMSPEELWDDSVSFYITETTYHARYDDKLTAVRGDGTEALRRILDYIDTANYIVTQEQERRAIELYLSWCSIAYRYINLAGMAPSDAVSGYLIVEDRTDIENIEVALDAAESEWNAYWDGSVYEIIITAQRGKNTTGDDTTIARYANLYPPAQPHGGYLWDYKKIVEYYADDFGYTVYEQNKS